MHLREFRGVSSVLCLGVTEPFLEILRYKGEEEV